MCPNDQHKYVISIGQTHTVGRCSKCGHTWSKPTNPPLHGEAAHAPQFTERETLPTPCHPLQHSLKPETMTCTHCGMSQSQITNQQVGCGGDDPLYDVRSVRASGPQILSATGLQSLSPRKITEAYNQLVRRI